MLIARFALRKAVGDGKMKVELTEVAPVQHTWADKEHARIDL